MTLYSLQQRGAIADAQAVGHSHEASAIEEVARAQLELANADPADRAALRKTLAKELQARQRQLLIGGGNVPAITYSVDQGYAYGIGLNLGGTAGDLGGAISALGKGINEVNSGQIVGQSSNGAKTNELLQRILNAILNSNGGKLPSMFQN